MPATEIENFGANVRFTPRVVYRPRSAEEVLEILSRESSRQLRAVGSLHAWSEAAECEDVVINLEELNSVEFLSGEDGVIARIGGGCQIKRIIAELAKRDLAMPSLGLISEQTIAGATSTATHGSGRHCLSHYLTAVHIAHYDSDTGIPKVTQIRDAELLRAAKCGLGCLGIIVAIELRPRSSYHIEEFMTIHESLDQALAMEAAYPLQQFFFLPWYEKYLGQHRRESQHARSRLATLYRWYWFATIDVGLHVILKAIVQWLRSPRLAKAFFRFLAPATLIRNWHVVDHSHDMLVMEHELFRHIEIEIFVTRSQLGPAMELTQEMIRYCDSGAALSPSTCQAAAELGCENQLNQANSVYTHHYPICIRRVVPDDMWLSMSNGGSEDFYAISLIAYHRPNERQGFFQFADLMARIMAKKFQGRCHWGKYCPSDRMTIESLYPGLSRFREAANAMDAKGSFRNSWVNEVIFDT
jgi:L-gulono-1,4-lactone dehydrogenase